MVDITNLEFSYKNKSLYEELSINFKKGHIYGLFGKNGSGKTTLLNLISGTLFSQRGKIETLDFNPKNREFAMLNDIFYLSQESVLPEWFSNKSIHKWFCHKYIKLYSPFYPNFDYEKFDEYCKAFELEQNKKLKTFSIGQQKKFLIAFGLARNCSLNIFDEPTNGLDIPSKSTFRKLITSNTDKDKTFIISTHQVKDIENIIDNICIVENGKVILDYSLDTLANALEMRVQDSLYENEIYSEDLALEFKVLRENKTNQPSSIDLELLFNASISKANELNEICSFYQRGAKHGK